ncbi:MAG: hypothetical protein ACQGVC_12140 [Myxococcota bacterium]
MKIVLVLLAVLVLGVLAAMGWQHARYLAARRGPVQDHQPVLHGSGVFHTITYLRVAPGTDPVDAVRTLRQDLAAAGDVQWVYAGKVAVDALQSSQLGDRNWSAIVVLQHPSREAFDALAGADTWGKALARFPETYTHGFRRSPLVNLMIPQMLLGLRARQVVSGDPQGYPFEPASDAERVMERDERIDQLQRERELGAEALVIVNLIRHGTAEQQSADRRYGFRMAQMMARLGYGPMHMGEAVTVEGDARFDRAAIVYYPGIDYFTEMANSRYFQGIIGGKQLGDTTATMTVPILDRL